MFLTPEAGCESVVLTVKGETNSTVALLPPSIRIGFSFLECFGSSPRMHGDPVALTVFEMGDETMLADACFRIQRLSAV